MTNLDHTNLHRTAKYFMDSGRVASHEEALGLLQSFGLSIVVDPAVAATRNGQIAVLTLVNLARRTLLGGVEVVGLPSVPLGVRLAKAKTFADAVVELGGSVATEPRDGWPVAALGPMADTLFSPPTWHLAWEGWRGGVVPAFESWRPTDPDAMPLTPAIAAAACAAEVFAYHAGDHPLAGKRAAGLSLWQPGADWRFASSSEPTLAYLPSHLWLIGLGNLGQAYSWLLACLPYKNPADVTLVLQDYDRMAKSNDSTSLLATLRAVRKMKTRWVASWLERRGFSTLIEERSFGEWTRRISTEPAVALCGVDNGPTRASLEHAGFDVVIESGLGAGPQSFRSFSMHSFPGARRADQIWSAKDQTAAPDVSQQPAYDKLRMEGFDTCGLAQLASRTVGVPFVGLIAGGFVIAELLRRLHGGPAYDVISGSVSALENIEAIIGSAGPYLGGYGSAA